MLDSGLRLEFLKFSVRVDDPGFWNGVGLINRIRVTRCGKVGDRKEASGQGSRHICCIYSGKRVPAGPFPSRFSYQIATIKWCR